MLRIGTIRSKTPMKLVNLRGRRSGNFIGTIKARMTFVIAGSQGVINLMDTIETSGNYDL